jgi:hypothetical protein
MAMRLAIFSFGLFAAMTLPALAGPEKVELPADWRTRFVVYTEIERPDRTPNQVRIMYVNPEAATAARAGVPAPANTVLVMEDRAAILGADGKALRDAKGRMVMGSQTLAIAVMEKRAGWGSEYPTSQLNGEWEYASYTPDGAKRAGVNTQPCFACHLPRTGGRDYTFTFMRWVEDGKPGPR